MYADDLLVLSPSPEGLQKSINVVKKHAEEWKLKVNTKKSNIIIFSGNVQTKNNENFQYGSETLPIVDKQTYLGIEMTSSGRYRSLSCNAETKDFARLTSHPVRGWTGKNKAFCSPGTQTGCRMIKVYTYARDILSKKAYKVLATEKRLFSNSDTTTITIKNKLFDALVKPILLYGCEIWGPELLSDKTHFDKSTIEQVHIKFCKQTLNTPCIACRAEIGRYPLSIDIKASIFSYWLRLQHETVNPLLKEAFHHARNHSQFFDVLDNDETIRMHFTSNISSQQPIKNARSSIKKQLKKDFIRNWLKARNNTSECSREKFTHKEVKHNHQLEDYVRTIRNPAHRISMTKLRLGVHSLRIQTEKYENRGTPIPVEGRMCLVCNRGYIEDERHFLMCCPGYDNIRNELHSLLSTHDVVFKSLSDEDRIRYLLTLENETTSKIVGKYTYLMFQKRKDILHSKYNLI